MRLGVLIIGAIVAGSARTGVVTTMSVGTSGAMNASYIELYAHRYLVKVTDPVEKFAIETETSSSPTFPQLPSDGSERRGTPRKRLSAFGIPMYGPQCPELGRIAAFRVHLRGGGA